LHWTKARPSAQCWWCQSPKQARDHLFKECRRWREQQKTLWEEVRKETKKGKSRWKIQDLMADGRCSQAVLCILSTTDVGRLVPPKDEGDAGSEVSEWELRERQEREEERRAEAEVLGAGEELGGEERPLFLPTPSFMASAGD